MSTDPTKQPGIRLENIFLIKSEFNRAGNVDIEHEDGLEFALQINKDTDNTHYVFLTCTLEKISISDKKSLAKIIVQYVALIKKDEVNENMDIDMFCRKIAPSLIFPYIREHIHTTFLNAGILTSPIQPLNLQAILAEIMNKL